MEPSPSFTRSDNNSVRTESPVQYQRRLASQSSLRRGSAVESLIQSHGELDHPRKAAKRVRDLGRDICVRANSCTWIQFMTESPDDAGQREVKEGGKAEAPSNIPPVVSGSVTRSEITKPEMTKPDVTKSEMANQETPFHASVQAKESHNDVLRRLQDQQQDLIRQQEALNEQLKQQMSLVGKLDAGDEKRVIETPEEMEQIPSPMLSPVSSQGSTPKHASMPSVNRVRQPPSHCNQRRLKGEVAHFCAKRSEGSIKTLFCHEENNSGLEYGYDDDAHATKSYQTVRTTNSLSCNNNNETQQRRGRNVYVQNADSSQNMHEVMSYACN